MNIATRLTTISNEVKTKLNLDRTRLIDSDFLEIDETIYEGMSGVLVSWNGDEDEMFQDDYGHKTTTSFSALIYHRESEKFGSKVLQKYEQARDVLIGFQIDDTCSPVVLTSCVPLPRLGSSQEISRLRLTGSFQNL